ncbi:MAG: CynX/NimT family MFS transporter [Chelatococcus sp.]|uniref:CynX/NimT family MFS transporter n=1 Tax=Chelatococcus sp. TaxID=1953771 RepID=UPI0025C11623|nr:CynX/NimT family MFS transporter [Chelatococcus sp.]MBX3537134.1 CynX/NimT family MFS transporter [Chelatococcus sp.]
MTKEVAGSTAPGLPQGHVFPQEHAAPQEQASPQEPAAPTLADELLPEAELVEPPQALVAAAGLPRWWLAVVLVLVSLNLRPALSSVGSVLEELMRDTGASTTFVSVLTTLPVLCLGAFGLTAPPLARRFGTERVVLVILLVMAAGLALRLFPSFLPLLGSAIIAGASIGIIGVLMPGLVKRDFPRHASLMTGVYTMALCAGGALGAGATVPLARAFDSWPAALAFWAVPAVLAAILWWPSIPKRLGNQAKPVQYAVTGLWRDRLAWQVTLFTGLQSLLAYIVLGWLIQILRDRGLDPLTAGLTVSGSVLAQVPAALIAPLLAARRRDQRGMIIIIMSIGLVGMLGCLFAPLSSVAIWAALLGIGQGGNFALALLTIVLRSPDSHVAARLSSMAQSVGYTLAATGPFATGLLHSWTGSWDSIALLYLGVTIAGMLFGLGAGRARHVNVKVTPLPQKPDAAPL